MTVRAGIVCALLSVFPASAATLEGSVTSTDGAPIPYAFVSLLGEDYAFLGYALADADGAFRIESDSPGARIAVQPPGKTNDEGIDVYEYMPRVYELDGAERADIKLPPAGCIVLKGYDDEGNLMRWEDWEKRGVFGGTFMYWTDAKGRMQEAVPWPVHDEYSKEQESPRRLGLPALCVPVGSSGIPYVLFWEITGDGKLQLPMSKFTIERRGQSIVVNVNHALAYAAIESLAQTPNVKSGNVDFLWNELTEEPAEDVLVNALRARDKLVLANARSAIESMSDEKRGEFIFGLFGTKPIKTEQYAELHEMGFSMVTVLTGWAWTDFARGTTAQHAATALAMPTWKKQGFTIKEHGAVWLQELGIMPPRAKRLSHAELREAYLTQLESLVDAFAADITLWEAMNEPATINSVGMPRKGVLDLMTESAALLKDRGLPTLVNSGHEGDYGNKYLAYSLDGKPTGHFRQTYHAFLETAQEGGALDNIDVIGLQFYPGAHLEDYLGDVQGPAITPAQFQDQLDLYAEFGKPIHITECSFPSRYEDGWTSGYWREPWTEAIQADYAEQIITIAFAHPAVESFTWWDVNDESASVVSGGLYTRDGRPKEIAGKLGEFIPQLTGSFE